SGTESEVQDANSRSGNDPDADDADIRPIYDKEQMAKVQLNAECNIFAIGQQHTEQPDIINEGQHGQVLNDESNKAKIKKEIDVLETINIELEHKVANFCKENETLKKHYKDLATADSKPKPRSTNHSSRSLPMSKSSCVTMPAMPKADHSKSPRKLFDSCANKVKSEPPHGSNVDISKIHEYKQTLDLSAVTSINVPKEQILDVSAGKVTQAYRTVTTSNELDLLFSLLFDELLNGSSKVVSKSSAVSAADALNQRQQYTTSLNNHTTPAPTCQVLTLELTVISSENINQAETYAENYQVADDEFINIFSIPVQDQGETSTRHVNSSNMHTFYQRCPLSLHQRECQKGIVELFFVGTEYQLADLFTKALPVERFQYLVRRLGMRCLTPAELEALANESA
nr:ribonuclease H [Tanacetum cinerariifolium]